MNRVRIVKSLITMKYDRFIIILKKHLNCVDIVKKILH